MSTDKVVLDFYDSSLHLSDLELLNDGAWLNDKLIGFYMEYLENVVYKDKENVTFLVPSFVQLIKTVSPVEAEMIFAPLDLDHKDLIFIPVSNAVNVGNPGASYWSLLVYNKKQNRYLHYDSFGCNLAHAKTIKSKLDGAIINSEEILEPPTPHQNNLYDCGVLVLCNLDSLCKMWLTEGSNEIDIKYYEVEPEEKRQRVKDLIRSLSL